MGVSLHNFLHFPDSCCARRFLSHVEVFQAIIDPDPIGSSKLVYANYYSIFLLQNVTRICALHRPEVSPLFVYIPFSQSYYLWSSLLAIGSVYNLVYLPEFLVLILLLADNLEMNCKPMASCDLIKEESQIILPFPTISGYYSNHWLQLTLQVLPNFKSSLHRPQSDLPSHK